MKFLKNTINGESKNFDITYISQELGQFEETTNSRLHEVQ